MTGMGQFDSFPQPRLSARCWFSQRTFVGTQGDGREAPLAVTRRCGTDCPSLCFGPLLSVQQLVKEGSSRTDDERIADFLRSRVAGLRRAFGLVVEQAG